MPVDSTRKREFVYFVRCPSNGYLKIGRSLEPEYRFRSLARFSPVPIERFAWMDGDPGIETAWHHMFEADRSHGEWFRPSDELLALIGKFATPWVGDPRDSPAPAPRPPAAERTPMAPAIPARRPIPARTVAWEVQKLLATPSLAEQSPMTWRAIEIRQLALREIAERKNGSA